MCETSESLNTATIKTIWIHFWLHLWRRRCWKETKSSWKQLSNNTWHGNLCAYARFPSFYAKSLAGSQKPKLKLKLWDPKSCDEGKWYGMCASPNICTFSCLCQTKPNRNLQFHNFKCPSSFWYFFRFLFFCLPDSERFLAMAIRVVSIFPVISCQIYSAHCPNGWGPSFTVTIFDIHWPFSSAPRAPSFFFADPWPLDRTRHSNLNRNERMKREIKFDKFYLRIEMEDLWALFGQDSGELEGTARYKGSWS